MTSPGHDQINLREIPRRVIQEVEDLYEWTRAHPGEYHPLSWPTPHEKEEWLVWGRQYAEKRPDGRLTLRQKRGTTTRPRSVEIQAVDYDPGRSRRGKDRDQILDQLVDQALDRLRPDLGGRAVDLAAAPVLRWFAEESVRRLCVEGREQTEIRTQWGVSSEEQETASVANELLSQ